MYGEILDIFGGGVITKLDYFWVSFIYFFPKVKVQNWNIFGGLVYFKYFWGCD